MKHITKTLLIMSLFAALTSCSAKKEAAVEPAGITYKTHEITVRQCSDIGDHEFSQLLEQHDTTIKKQVSPHLYIVAWDDSRSASEVVHELSSTAMFCGVDKYQE